jgi:hypothetical protein
MFNNLTPTNGNNLDPNKFVPPPSAPLPPAPKADPPAGGSVAVSNAEDIFKDVKDLGAKPTAFQPKPAISITESEFIDTPPATNEERLKKYFALSIMVLFLVLVVLGGVVAYGRLFSKSKVPAITNTPAESQADNQNSQPSENNPTNQSGAIRPEAPIVNTPVATSSNIDTDQDSLTDEEESRLGTNPKSADSDNDGLFDKEEFKTYKTDPMNADTDGDGFLDGEEVKGGYNPLGPGKLYEINK